MANRCANIQEYRSFSQKDIKIEAGFVMLFIQIARFSESLSFIDTSQSDDFSGALLITADTPSWRRLEPFHQAFVSARL